MRYRSAGAFRQALETRLASRAAETRMSLARLRKLVVFDRLLARLLEVAADRWVLKGALALYFRYPTRARATKDMDLGRTDDEQAATKDLLRAQSVDLDDHFSFAVERSGTFSTGGISYTTSVDATAVTIGRQRCIAMTWRGVFTWLRISGESDHSFRLNPIADFG